MRAIVLALLLCGATSAYAQADPAPEAAPDPGPESTDPAAEARALRGVRYFPLEEGRRWLYRLRSRLEPAEGGEEEDEKEEAGAPDESQHRLDVYVTDPVPVDGAKAAVLEWKLDGVLAQRSYFRLGQDFLLCLRRLQGSGEHVKEFSLVPPQQFLPAAPKVGMEWSWAGKSGPSSGTQRFRIVRSERIEVPAGSFETLVVESEFTGEDDSRGKTTRWLAPGVGIVKEVSEVRTPTQRFRSEGVLVKYEAS
ncbi:MAG: hypothetical protein D6731_13795 [Planctomycetota bacterium]|nr:MAG: hypothetical protein D6731_13795 [Planctomycetota bacterium]